MKAVSRRQVTCRWKPRPTKMESPPRDHRRFREQTITGARFPCSSAYKRCHHGTYLDGQYQARLTRSHPQTFHKSRYADTSCRRQIEKSPLAQIEMSLSTGFES